MNSTAMIREAAALRHNFQFKKRLQLEFLAGLSKLLRDHGVRANDELLSNVILAVPDELMNGNGATSNGRALAAGKNGRKTVIPPQSGTKKRKTAIPPQPGTKKRKSVIIPPQPGTGRKRGSAKKAGGKKR